jgi:hypothetical protein
MCHRVEERNVGTWSNGEVAIRVLRQLDTPRIDDDERSSAPAGGLFDARADDRVILGGVRPEHQNGAGVLDVVE